jgi:protoporphyrinogen oxidase
MKDPIAILGGGLAGLTLASELHKRNIDFRLYEKDESLGGIARTESLGDFNYDRGAHRFHNRDAELSNWVRELLKDELVEVNKASAISRNSSLINFPLSPLNLMSQNPVTKSLRYAFDWARRSKAAPTNLEEHAIHKFGKSLAEDFVLQYSEKLWGCPAKELSLELGSGRLKALDLPTLIKELIVNKEQNHKHIDGRVL